MNKYIIVWEDRVLNVAHGVFKTREDAELYLHHWLTKAFDLTEEDIDEFNMDYPIDFDDNRFQIMELCEARQ